LIRGNNEAPFHGGLFGLRETGVWDENAEQICLRVLESILHAHDIQARPSADSVFLFEPAERLDLEVFLTQAILIGWDAFVVPHAGDYFVFVSHDGPVSVVTKPGGHSEEWLQILSRDWEVSPSQKYTP
jgi:hypothetical protein